VAEVHFRDRRQFPGRFELSAHTPKGQRDCPVRPWSDRLLARPTLTQAPATLADTAASLSRNSQLSLRNLNLKTSMALRCCDASMNRNMHSTQHGVDTSQRRALAQAAVLSCSMLATATSAPSRSLPRGDGKRRASSTARRIDLLTWALPHLPWDSARPGHIHTGTGRAHWQVESLSWCGSGTQLPGPFSLPRACTGLGLGSQLHIRAATYARPCHVTVTIPTMPHLRRSSARGPKMGI
jgi:hypothetical protein